MADRLQIRVDLKAHPYPGERNAPFEAWAHISVDIVRGAQRVSLYDGEWDAAALAEWFAENRQALCHDGLPLSDAGDSATDAESLAQALDRLQARDFGPDQDEAQFEWADALFAYRERHSLRFALRGARVPPIVIGCQHGDGEIALSSPEGEWSYRFDMTTFCNEFSRVLQDTLEHWMAASQVPETETRGRPILERLRGGVSGCCA